MIAVMKGPALLHIAGQWSGLLVVPFGIVFLGLLFMAAVLIREAIRRARCPHDDERLRRQESNYQHYFAEVCMRCGKASGAKV